MDVMIPCVRGEGWMGYKIHDLYDRPREYKLLVLKIEMTHPVF